MKSVDQIRQRLLLLLGRAFLSALLLLIFLLPIITAFALTNYSEKASLRFPLIGYLEGYYQGHGSWDGIESVFQTFDSFPPEYTLLLDENNRIILDGGQASVSTVGSSYQFSSTDVKFQLQVDNQMVGALVSFNRDAARSIQ